MDFFRIVKRETKDGKLEIFPDFVVGRSKDLMVRARGFHAIWDETASLWSTDEYMVQKIVDEKLRQEADIEREKGETVLVKYLNSFDSGSWSRFQAFLKNVSDNSQELDDKLTFANEEVTKSDYVSRRLSYPLLAGDHSAWDELIGTLYFIEERAKIEWAIGAIVAGDSKNIQKFLVLYGPAGTGKSTVLNIISKMFEGYVATFEAKALGSNNNAFATEAFKANPLVAIQHDGDLSKIEDNTKLNSIISHEDMLMNEKYKPGYTSRINAFLFMGTNQPVKISDSKSGIIRRLIDVHPSGDKVSVNHYNSLMQKIDFELGAIAHHCLQVYKHMGKHYYNPYRPVEMMFQTDVFFNFVEANYDIFKGQDGATLKQAYQLYKEYCTDTGIERPIPQYKVREELRNYFTDFHDKYELDGHIVRSYYAGFSAHPFKQPVVEEPSGTFALVVEEETSLLDGVLADCPAQPSTESGVPGKQWSRVKTTLSDMNTKQEHYVKVPDNHIVIDFDLKDENGEKSLVKNLEAASVWPATYAEISKSGAGVHLHYIYDGDTNELALAFADGIEVKVYSGNASLRRRLSLCNAVPIARISGGLPKKEKKVLSATTMQSEKGLRDLIERNLRKEIHPGTKPSIDFIVKILEDAHEAKLTYDVSDMRPKILTFATRSSNKSIECIKLVDKMQWKGGDKDKPAPVVMAKDDRLVFFDVEVYSNLFVVCYKFQGNADVVRLINPDAQAVEALFGLKLVGFNNRRYDNHILYARYLGYDNAGLFNLSQQMVNSRERNGFAEAYNLSYCDIWDFSSIKDSLKKFEIKLNLHHMEMDLPWDQPVPEKLWPKVVEYCVNDVEATEAVFEDRKGDFTARQILAELSGLSINDSTPKHTARIIFGSEKSPQRHFIYHDLGEEFPGYSYSFGKSEYRGENPGEGGYVYAEPGMYQDVALLDIASMHPTSLIKMNHFGDFTKNYEDLMLARLAIKKGDYDAARKMLGGKLAPYLEDKNGAKDLSYALKIVINIVYGLTSAKFENPFRDPRNKDNIVAKRGALFMIDLKHLLQDAGYKVIHIKTDSVKIANATPEAIQMVMEYGEKYGYTFEHEDTYDRMCLVNDAVYIARKAECVTDCWKAVGAQFQHPYVFKTLFSGEEVAFEDLCETRAVMKGNMFLDFGVTPMQFVGRVGLFVPVTEQGATLYRVNEGKNYAVTGTKDRKWIEAEVAKEKDLREAIDLDFFESLADAAIKTIEKFGSYQEFIGDRSCRTEMSKEILAV